MSPMNPICSRKKRMRKSRRRVASVLFALCLFAAVPGLGQQGHPLTGTWSGDWGTSPTQRNKITLVMNWDGQKVTGIVNPGPDSFPIGSVYVDVTNWTIRVEADSK